MGGIWICLISGLSVIDCVWNVERNIFKKCKIKVVMMLGFDVIVFMRVYCDYNIYWFGNKNIFSIIGLNLMKFYV